MDRRDIEQIDRFLSIVGKSSLFEYLGLDTDVDNAAAEAAIKKRRQWAQGQQANPKYRSESLWVIKNQALLKRALLEQRQSYLSEVTGRDEARNLEVLALFIRGTLVDGQLTPKKEEAIRRQGDQLGLSEPTVSRQIDAMLGELGASRGGEDEPTEDLPLVDHYAILEVDRNASQEALEKAYRAKYRWARNLRDVKKASEVYAQLDEAWRILKDPDKREAYNERLADLGEDPVLDIPGPPGGSPSGELAISPGAPPSRKAPPVHASPTAPQPKPTSTNRPLRFQPDSASGSIPPVRQAPRPPERISGRTLGLGNQANRAADTAPRLQIDGPEVHKVETFRAPHTVRFTIRNAGSGQMSGRVFSDRDWVEVSPSRLDPEAVRQTIEVTIHPKSMPRSKAVSLITVVADHGERKVVTIETERRLLPGGLFKIFGGVLALLLLVGVAVVGLAMRGGDSGSLGLPHRLVVSVDPPQGRIYVAGELMGESGYLDTSEGFPLDQPFELRVEHWGFLPYTETLTVSSDGPAVQKRDVNLKLDPSTTWRPAQGAIPTVVPVDAVDAALGYIEPRLQACLTQGAVPAATLEVKGYVRPQGEVYKVDFLKQKPKVPALESCVRRQLRGLKFQPLTGEPVATFETELSLAADEG